MISPWFGCSPTATAEYGTGPEVLSRTFKRLEGDGIIANGTTTVTLLDPARPADLAEWLGS